MIRVQVRSARRLTALLERVAVLADQLEEADHEEELVQGAGHGEGRVREGLRVARKPITRKNWRRGAGSGSGSGWRGTGRRGRDEVARAARV